MNEQALLETLAGADAGAAQAPAQADILLLATPTREQSRARTRQFLSLLRRQDACGRDDDGAWQERADQTAIHLPEGGRAILYHASGALRYVSGLAPADAGFAAATERDALVRLLEERARALALPDWAGSGNALRFEHLFQTLGRGADHEGKQSATTLFRATGAWRQFIGGLPVLGGASAAVRLAGDGRLDGLSILVRPASGEVLDRAALVDAQTGARAIVLQLATLLGKDAIPEGLVEAASMRLGYLDLGKRKVQRVLAPAWVAQVVVRHKSVRQAYVLAARATERSYLDLPVYGSGAVPTSGRAEQRRCDPGTS